MAYKGARNLLFGDLDFFHLTLESISRWGSSRGGRGGLESINMPRTVDDQIWWILTISSSVQTLMSKPSGV